MRKLQTSDVFCALRIIEKAQVKDEVKRIAMISQKKAINVRELGIEFLLGIIGKMSGTEVEKEIYKFFANILEIDAEDIAVMDPIDFINEVVKLSEIIDKEKWSDFFKLVARLLK